MPYPIKSPRKLIEVALPLDAINAACATEKSIRHGHPSTLHLWWARRPLAAARAVIFAQLVNDPGYQQGGGFKYGKNKKEASEERARLFKMIEDLVRWENTTNEGLLEAARLEIRRSWREVCDLNKDHPDADVLFNPENLPAFYDPFAGGGSLPLEAQRLGLEAFASDLNPVASLITKALIEIPHVFKDRPPVNPENRRAELGVGTWKGASGLAEDVRYYGKCISDEARARIGSLYPDIEITPEMAIGRPDLQRYVATQVTVSALIWTRTVKSPNPAFSHADVPLISTFLLCTKGGKEAYVEPIVDGSEYRFTVRLGKPQDVAAAKKGTKLSQGSFRCIFSNTPIPYTYIDDEANAGRMGARLMAIVAEGDRGRIYLNPTPLVEAIALTAVPTWKPETPSRGTWASNAQGRKYGFKTFGDYFTPRQLTALTTFSDVIHDFRNQVRSDAIEAGLSADSTKLQDGGDSAEAYSEAVTVYLALGLDKCADYWNNLCTWAPHGEYMGHLFTRQALPMAWDYTEANPFSNSSGNWEGMLVWVIRVLRSLGFGIQGTALQYDAQSQTMSAGKVVSTDPPYYDNIGYADLSDFFYVWLRRSLKSVFPTLFATLAVPKAEELVAESYRHGSKLKAEEFFLDGMTKAMHRLAQQAHPAFPVTIYYAFKQAESQTDGTSSPGWETFLEAVIEAGFVLTGTWPMRTEMGNRMVGSGTNALASSIILVCRKRPDHASTISSREFIRELNSVLPEALDEMTKGSGETHSPVAPVDLSQAIIGPGMAIFSKYSSVVKSDGAPMSVKTALQLINRFLAEDDFDADTQFCLHWFEQYGWADGPFGTADTLSRGKGTSVEGMKAAGVLLSGGGNVRLLKWSEYPTEWDPVTDTRTPIWEALHHLIRALKQRDETACGTLLAALGGKADPVRQLAYRLYTLCERLGKAEDARAYNEIITSWTGIETAAARAPKSTNPQGSLFEE